MRISYWCSDVCSSDLLVAHDEHVLEFAVLGVGERHRRNDRVAIAQQEAEVAVDRRFLQRSGRPPGVQADLDEAQHFLCSVHHAARGGYPAAAVGGQAHVVGQQSGERFDRTGGDCGAEGGEQLPLLHGRGGVADIYLLDVAKYGRTSWYGTSVYGRVDIVFRRINK